MTKENREEAVAIKSITRGPVLFLTVVVLTRYTCSKNGIEMHIFRHTSQCISKIDETGIILMY